MRGDAETMSKHGASIQGAATGLPVASLPDFGEVRLRDGTMVRPRSVLTTTETGQGLVSVVEQSFADSVVPDSQDITAGKLYEFYSPPSLTISIQTSDFIPTLADRMAMNSRFTSMTWTNPRCSSMILPWPSLCDTCSPPPGTSSPVPWSRTCCA